jgi:hypothetical protein
MTIAANSLVPVQKLKVMDAETSSSVNLVVNFIYISEMAQIRIRITERSTDINVSMKSS